MTLSPRVLDPEPVRDLDAYLAVDGMAGVLAARTLDPAALIELVDAAGLRGRGGAGFPTATKWRAVVEMASSGAPATVVVNAAEGEPGSFKDRAILRSNPYRVLEGALIAARAVAADRVVVATKSSFDDTIQRLRTATGELERAGWLEGIALDVVEGPTEYLFGEETALLEAVDGRPPFPRIAPPYRHGVDEIGDEPDARSAAQTELASPGDASPAPPSLANNVETLANVPGIVVNGADWFRSVGTAESPGTIVVTVSGSVRHAGVAEIAMGTPLDEVIAQVGGGARAGRTLVAAVSGVANAVLPATRFSTPLTYEHMRDAGSGLGAAGFIVLDDADDPVAFAAGVARFLAIESCGQCAPCKVDGLAIAAVLDRVRRSEVREDDMVTLDDRLRTVADGARCNLASQQQAVIGSILDVFASEVAVHVRGERRAASEVVVAPLVDHSEQGLVVDESQRRKQPDWSFDETDSGQLPAERLSTVNR